MDSERDSQVSGSLYFSAVDELDEAAQALGWNIEYRQMGKGDFRAEFLSAECEGISLVAERFSNHLQIPCEPPQGFIGLFLPDHSAGDARVCGQTLDDGDLVFFPTLAYFELAAKFAIKPCLC